jgi:hypothetical protein
MAASVGVAILYPSLGEPDMVHVSALVNWRAWTDAKSEKAARIVASHLFSALDCSAENEAFAPYEKTSGWSFTFQTRLDGASRNDCVVAALALGMRVGYSWILSGDVFHSLAGWSNAARVSGITNLQWHLVDAAILKYS